MPEPDGPWIGDWDSVVVPDPRSRGPVPWPLYAQVALGAAVFAASWWASTLVTGVLRVVFLVLGVVAGLYAAYNLALVVAWLLMSVGLNGWMSRERRRDALSGGEQLLELRLGSNKDDEPSYRDDLFQALQAALGAHGECEEIESTGGAMTFHVHGPDISQMVDAVRRAAAGFPLPADAYLWVPDLARARYGCVVPLTP